MNRIAIAVLSIAIASLLACDPGMTIRQVQPIRSSSVQLTMEISPASKLIGSRFYDAKVKLINLSQLSITIKSCELLALNVKYESRLGGTESYPIELAPGTSAYLVPMFELKDSVDSVFRQPAELRVYYVIDGLEKIARTTLRGGSL